MIYAIKTRNGQVYMRLRRNYGDMSALEEEDLSEPERNFRRERSGGNYGLGTKEMQVGCAAGCFFRVVLMLPGAGSSGV